MTPDDLPDYCPVCGGVMVWSDELEDYDPYVGVDYQCEDCGLVWRPQ